MQPEELVRRSRSLAAIALVASVLLLLLILSLPFLVDHAELGTTLILFWGLMLLMVAVMASISIAYLFFTRGLRMESARESARVESVTAEETAETESAIDDERLLRALDDDSRAVYQVLVEAGGTIPQREIAVRTGFSASKVSRVLDKLGRKGLVVRERDGMANRVTLKRG